MTSDKFYILFSKDDSLWKNLRKDDALINHVSLDAIDDLYDTLYEHKLITDALDISSLYLECIRREFIDSFDNDIMLVGFLVSNKCNRNYFRDRIFLYNETMMRTLFGTFTEFKKALLSHTLDLAYTDICIKNGIEI